MPKLEITDHVRLPAVDLSSLADIDVPKPVYAGAGMADLAVVRIKEYVEAVTASAQAGRAAVTARVRARVEAGVGGLQADALSLPDKVTAAYLGAASEALGAYEKLAKRGEVVVARLRGAADAGAVDQAAADGTVVDEAALDGAVVDGTVVDEAALDGAAVDGADEIADTED